MQNYKETLLSQYLNSPTLMALIESVNDAVDPSVDIQAFYDNIWNINTAVGYGLDVWGSIVGVSRILQVQTSSVSFGFGEAFVAADPTGGVQPFNQAPFSEGLSSTSSYTLPDDSYRTLIFAKAFANITDATIPNINNVLKILYGSKGKCFVLDDGGMKMKVVFNFAPTDFDKSVIMYSNVFPRPAGVLVDLIYVDVNNVAGFYGTGLQPANQAPFTPV